MRFSNFEKAAMQPECDRVKSTCWPSRTRTHARTHVAIELYGGWRGKDVNICWTRDRVIERMNSVLLFIQFKYLNIVVPQRNGHSKGPDSARYVTLI